MVKKITFKEYLASKEALREAIKQTPKQTSSYTIARYCNFVLGESKEDRSSVSLKPNHVLTIEWLYEDIDNPTATSVSFDGVTGIDPITEMIPAWTDQKIKKWLIRNTK